MTTPTGAAFTPEFCLNCGNTNPAEIEAVETCQSYRDQGGPALIGACRDRGPCTRRWHEQVAASMGQRLGEYDYRPADPADDEPWTAEDEAEFQAGMAAYAADFAADMAARGGPMDPPADPDDLPFD